MLKPCSPAGCAHPQHQVVDGRRVERGDLVQDRADDGRGQLVGVQVLQ